MKKNKKKLLWPISNCCLKKFYDLDSISKYGSIFIILIFLSFQAFNVSIGYKYEMSFLSMIINAFFLVVVLTRLGILKIAILEARINGILKFMIFVFVVNTFGYFSSDIQLHNYFFAPLSFLGAYFTFLLLTTK